MTVLAGVSAAADFLAEHGARLGSVAGRLAQIRAEVDDLGPDLLALIGSFDASINAHLDAVVAERGEEGTNDYDAFWSAVGWHRIVDPAIAAAGVLGAPRNFNPATQDAASFLAGAEEMV